MGETEADKQKRVKTGLIIAVVILSIFIVYIFVMVFCAIGLKKPILHKLSLIGPLGEMSYKACYKNQGFGDQMIHQIAKHSHGRLQQQPQQPVMQQQAQQQMLDSFATSVPETPIATEYI